MAVPDPVVETAAMLTLWERGVGGSLTARGLALLGAQQPAAFPDPARATIGQRDAALLDLYEQLFGGAIDCRLPCPACGAAIEVSFAAADVRAPAATPDTAISIRHGDYALRARPPDSADLIAVESEPDPSSAERRLFERVVTATRRGRPVSAAALPAAAIAAVGEAVTAADPQAEVMIALACPDCATPTQAPFDIVTQLWARLDDWARAMLAAVDALASRYGWSEPAILALSPSRRQYYLDLIAGVAR